jgi:hypothetical protein
LYFQKTSDAKTAVKIASGTQQPIPTRRRGQTLNVVRL